MRRPILPLVTTLLLALPALVAASEEAEPVTSHFGVADWIWKSVNLLLFAFLLVWFAGRPIAAQLRKRREKIASDLADAAKKREEAARTEEEIRRKIAALEAEIEDFARKAREDGERERQELSARGELEAQKVLAQAKDEVTAQVVAARRELAAYAGELAVELAAKSVESKMGPADRSAFLDRAVAEIGKSEAGR